MSLLVAMNIAPGRIFVGVDTLGFIQPGSSKIPGYRGPAEGVGFETSKLFLLPHANVVLAGRGTIGFLNMLWQRIACDASATNYDRIVGEMFQHIADTRAMINRSFERLGMHGDMIGRQEILCAGWSDVEQTLCLRAFDFNGPDEPVDEWRYICNWVEPWWPERLGPEPVAVTPEAMAALAQRQIQELREHHPPEEQLSGGRFLVAEITRESTSVRAVCSLEIAQKQTALT